MSEFNPEAVLKEIKERYKQEDNEDSESPKKNNDRDQRKTNWGKRQQKNVELNEFPEMW